MDKVENAILNVVANRPKQRLTGRTLLQKTLFFLNELEGLGIRFRPHYYGPFSDEVTNATASLVARGALHELAESFVFPDDPFEARRYTYQLTDLGKAMMESQPAEETACESHCETIWQESTDYNELAAASKLYYILSKDNERCFAYDAIREKAKGLGWDLTKEQLEKAVSLLQTLFGEKEER